MEREGVLNKSIKDFSKQMDIIQIILICIGALIVPTFLANLLQIIFGANSIITSNSQIIVGTVVNTALIVAAMNIKGWKKIVGIITLPSISTILGGFVFKTASIYMAYMIPAIWLGNFAVIYLYKTLLLNKKINYFLSGIISIGIKVAIIFLAFNILNLIGIFPEKLVQNLQKAMGFTQLITATLGMIISYPIYSINNKNKA